MAVQTSVRAVLANPFTMAPGIDRRVDPGDRLLLLFVGLGSRCRSWHIRVGISTARSWITPTLSDAPSRGVRSRP